MPSHENMYGTRLAKPKRDNCHFGKKRKPKPAEGGK